MDPISSEKNVFSFDEDYRYCILLTAYVGDPSLKREPIYLQSIHNWLNNTDLHVYMVESSGKSFDVKHERFHQFTFTQSEGFVKLSPSAQEKMSILQAYAHFKLDFDKYHMILKITGKYYLPELTTVMKSVPNTTDIIFQHQTTSHGQNSELVGIRPAVLPYVMRYIGMQLKHFEHVLAMTVEMSKYKTYKLPPLNILDRTPRGDGSVLLFM